ncbi:MAG: MBL fold metallo-hydrolase [Deltaproteobacteria bacterium]|nr:MAG: MBL fold metallo-hydrolase [Deltaproteobacteria bacterium]
MEKLALGTAKALTVRCLSELSWHDNARMRLDVREAGGLSADQFDVRWTPGNAAGVSALVEAVAGDGRPWKILMDVGWDVAYMDAVFRREGVDRLLADGKIDLVYVTHEHVDHFWGMPAVVKHRPDVKLMIPSGFSARSMELLKRSGHTGTVEEMPPGAHPLFPGCATVTFDQPIFLKTRGEQVLYVNVEGKGIVTITGCCHPGVLGLLEYAKERLEGFSAFHGVYGGLHISPFEEWGPPQEELLDKLQAFGVRKFACNHCTGETAVRKMLERGMEVAAGTARHGSKSCLYPGNGDAIDF